MRHDTCRARGEGELRKACAPKCPKTQGLRGARGRMGRVPAWHWDCIDNPQFDAASKRPNGPRKGRGVEPMSNETSKLPGESNKAYKARMAEVARVALLATPHAPPNVGSVASEPTTQEAPPVTQEAASTPPVTQEAPPVASEPAPMVPPTAPAPIVPDTQGAAYVGERKNPAHVAWLLNPIGDEPDKLHPDYRKWLRAGEKRRAAGKGVGAEHAEYVGNRADQCRKLADDVAHWGLNLSGGASLVSALIGAATALDSVKARFAELPSDFKAPARPEGTNRKGAAVVVGSTFSLKAGHVAEYDVGTAELRCTELRGTRIRAVRVDGQGVADFYASEHVSPASVKAPPPVATPPAVETAAAS